MEKDSSPSSLLKPRKEKIGNLRTQPHIPGGAAVFLAVAFHQNICVSRFVSEGEIIHGIPPRCFGTMTNPSCSPSPAPACCFLDEKFQCSHCSPGIAPGKCLPLKAAQHFQSDKKLQWLHQLLPFSWESWLVFFREFTLLEGSWFIHFHAGFGNPQQPPQPLLRGKNLINASQRDFWREGKHILPCTAAAPK